MPDDDFETPVLQELVRRCDRSNLEGFVRSFEHANGDQRAAAINACIVGMFEASLDEAD